MSQSLLERSPRQGPQVRKRGECTLVYRERAISQATKLAIGVPGNQLDEGDRPGRVA